MVDTWTTSTTAVFSQNLTKFVRAKLLDALRAGLPHLPAGAVDFETYHKGTDDTYAYPGIADLNVALVEHVGDIDPVAVEDLESYLITFATKEYARSVGWSSRLERRQPFPIAATVAEKVARDVAVAVDEVARTIWQAVHAGEVTLGLAANELSTDTLINAVATMQGFDIPPLPGGNYGLITHPYIVASLKRETGPKSWTETHALNNDPLLSGNLGTYQGVTFFASSRALPSGAPPASLTSILVGAKAMAYADLSSVQTATVLPTPTLYDPLGFKGISSWIARLGGAVIARNVEQGSAAVRYSHIKLVNKLVLPT